MQRRAIVVTGMRTDGTLGEIDVLDLDEESFRCFVLDRMAGGGLVPSSASDLSHAERLVYRQRIPPGHPRTK